MTPEQILQIIGITATSTAMLQFSPQAIRIHKMRKNPVELHGVSLGMLYLCLVNAVLWLVYSMFLQDFWVGAASYVVIPLAFMMIYYVRRARKHPEIEVYSTLHAPIALLGRVWGYIGPRYRANNRRD